MGGFRRVDIGLVGGGVAGETTAGTVFQRGGATETKAGGTCA